MSRVSAKINSTRFRYDKFINFQFRRNERDLVMFEAGKYIVFCDKINQWWKFWNRYLANRWKLVQINGNTFSVWMEMLGQILVTSSVFLSTVLQGLRAFSIPTNQCRWEKFSTLKKPKLCLKINIALSCWKYTQIWVNSQ